MAPGEAGGEVDGYDCVAAFGGGVGDVGVAGGAEGEVEADVVEVLGWRVSWRWVVGGVGLLSRLRRLWGRRRWFGRFGR